jgi:protein-S-isoprenylcysteine O-methyltransferase Ste14
MEFGYGLWPLVVINTLVVLIFAASFFHPRSGRDWRAFGVFSAFIVALFTEMYGVPLTIYLVTSWLGNSFLGFDLTHNGGHLWAELAGWSGDPHLSPFHLASYGFIIGGFWLMAVAWRRLYAAQKEDRLATEGPYARLRHPQYLGFILIMVGFLLQWPTIPTLLMFPVLLVVYRALAIREEREVRAAFGRGWDEYAAVTPRFIPRLGRHLEPPPAGSSGRPSDRMPRSAEPNVSAS